MSYADDLRETHYANAAAEGIPASDALEGIPDDATRESCTICGADLGRSSSFPWHLPDEDCRAIRDPIPDQGGDQMTKPMPTPMTEREALMKALAALNEIDKLAETAPLEKDATVEDIHSITGDVIGDLARQGYTA